MAYRISIYKFCLRPFTSETTFVRQKDDNKKHENFGRIKQQAKDSFKRKDAYLKNYALPIGHNKV